MTKIIEKSGVPRVTIADDAGLIYSDDWRKGWVSGFRELGCQVTVVDISQLRRVTAGGPYSVRGSHIAAALGDAIIKTKPDLVWCHHGRAAGNDFFLSRLRRRGIRSAVYLCDEPYEVGETARYSPKFDFVFSMDACTVETHKNARSFATRTHVFYLPPCADDRHFKYATYENRKIPALFLGNPMLRPREEWLRLVEKKVPGTEIRYWPQNGRPIAKGSPLWVPADKHPELYSQCIVGLNVHRHPGITKECFESRIKKRPRTMVVPHGAVLASKPPEKDGTGFWNDFDLPASHVNPRFFEFAACGTLVVSDDTRDEMRRMFPFSPVARDPNQFRELVGYYIEHQDEAQEIGRACCSLISKRHTYRHRAYEALTRVGLSRYVTEDRVSSLGVPEDFLTLQDFVQLKVKWSSARTGPSERWSPAFGLSWIRESGDPSRLDSLDAPPPVLPW